MSYWIWLKLYVFRFSSNRDRLKVGAFQVRNIRNAVRNAQE